MKGVEYMFKNIREDINSVFERDPAARSVLEIIFCYPGLHALWIYRIAHWLWIHEFFLPVVLPPTSGGS